jgi:hypothetical protein
VLGVAPHVWQAVSAQVLRHPPRGLRGARADHLDAHPLLALECLAARHEARQQHVAERPVLEQQRAQLFAIDRDVAQRLRGHGRQVDGLAGHEVHLSHESRGAVAHDLLARGVEHSDLALEDRNERIARVADAEEHLANLR